MTPFLQREIDGDTSRSDIIINAVRRIRFIHSTLVLLTTILLILLHEVVF